MYGSPHLVDIQNLKHEMQNFDHQKKFEAK